ncbi:hypothetical protein NA57DRAFT_46698 [Rhizodiscina lignyota]|uniref:AB hydrolase-1 domain-containing protein n=1 Tax=Rhizodiscina lignyota TaxID=1504668 RepID=A0A9P4M4R4_9PEZI|nr:hypothetical protein NA57DRAFT_46698 [Rhizodiscina lignyota]
MIGTSLLDYLFIRTCIFCLHSITPLSIFYCLVVFVLQISRYRTYWILEYFFVAETVFYLFIYLPRRHYLQAPAIHPPPLAIEQRRQLFQRIHESIPNIERFLSKWFLDAPMSEIKRENVKDLFRWALLNMKDHDATHDQELEQYIAEFEEVSGLSLEPGRGNAECMTLTFRPVNMWHRSLVWYFCVGFVDSLVCVKLLYHSFNLYRASLAQSLLIFPPRPFTLLSRFRSPVKNISYWHRPHRSKTRLPVLFIHGIGIGLYPYIDFLLQLNEENDEDEEHGQIGIIAVEIMPVSFRITHAAMERQDICEEIRQILAAHNWDQFVMVSHSYGTAITAQLLSDRQIAKQMKALVLIDPITFLLHLPDVAYNFVSRKAMRANEHQLQYFASTDMGVAHTLSRRFFWSEVIMWKQDIEGRQVTVSLAGKDLIVDTDAVRNYLTGDSDCQTAERHDTNNGPERDQTKWKGTGLDVLWYANLDHAQVFDKRSTRSVLVQAVRAYCSQDRISFKSKSV